MNNFEVLIIVIIITSLVILAGKIFKIPGCDHAQQTYYDAAGDELPGEQSEACFCKCLKCGREGVIPSGFQSDTHFEHFLYEKEQVSSKMHKKKID